jgi:hypothetical protein
MKPSSAINTKTPWCSKCKKYTDYKRVRCSEGSTNYCKECGQEMWSLWGCKFLVYFYRFLFLLCLAGFLIVLIQDFSSIIMLIVVGIIPMWILSLFFYRKPAKHLKDFQSWLKKQNSEPGP